MPKLLTRLSLAVLALTAATACTRVEASEARFTLPATAQVNGIHVAELSGPAWDADAGLLYAVSDRGNLFHLKLVREGGTFRIEPVFATPLVDPHATVAGAAFNAEAVTLVNADNGKPGDTELVVALEGTTPALARFRPDGSLIGSEPLPAALADPGKYRKKGRGLESVVRLPGLGVLTAPESPLVDSDQTRHTLYAADRQWTFPRESSNSRLKDLAALGDGSLLVLERSKGTSKAELTASVRRLVLTGCGDGTVCTATPVAVLPTGPDNFEGMALPDPGHALLVSDNGGDVALGTVFVLVDLP